MSAGSKTLLLMLLAAAFSLKTLPAKASHAAGAELLYDWVSGSTYRLYFKFYRDCSGVTESQNVTVCYRNSCNSTSGSLILQKMSSLPGGIANGTPVTVGCSSYPTKCDQPSSTLPGYREWWYSGTITLPTTCDAWIFSVAISARNTSENLFTTMGSTLYVEARLNNKDAQGNSSPFFSVKPVPYVCNGQNYTYNNGASDKDNDSLAFEMVNPLESSDCFSPSAIPFTSSTPTLNITTNPFQTNNSFTLDPTTGQISFLPGLLGAHTVTMKVSEYRNQKLIGSVMRDIQVSSLQCNTLQPVISIDSASLVQDSVIGNTVHVCAGVPMAFCFIAKSADTEAVLIVSDNHAAIIPSAGVNYSAQKTDSVKGCFSWTPTKADVGLKIFTVTVKDSTCKPPGISISQTFSIPINIRNAENALFDTAICLGDTVTLHPLVGNLHHWGILYGTPNSLSCYACTNPYAWPSNNTAYLVRTDQNAFCFKNVDTVTVQIKKEIPALPSASSNTPVCYGDTIKLFATPVAEGGYRWEGPNDFIDTAQNPIIPRSTFDNGGRYFLRTISYVSYCPSKPNFTDVDILPIPYAFFQHEEHVCIGQPAEIRPDRDYNSAYYWNFAGADQLDTSRLGIHYASWKVAGPKHVILRLKGKNGCFSFPDTGTVYVHSLPETQITQVSKNNICSNDTVGFTAEAHDEYIYNWLPESYFRGATGSTVKGVVEHTGFVFLKAINEWGCYGMDSTYISTQPCCDVYLPDAFTPNGDGKNDLFRILSAGHHAISKFIVVNRWGQDVFKTIDTQQGWDGTFNGKPLDAGTYFYFLRYKCSNGQYIDKKGEVTLVR